MTDRVSDEPEPTGDAPTPRQRVFLAFPADWDELTAEQRKAAALEMADKLIAELKPQS